MTPIRRRDIVTPLPELKTHQKKRGIMATQKNTGRTETARPAAMGLLFELDHTAATGRQFLYEACRQVLQEKDLALDPALFTRYRLFEGGAQGLARFLSTVDKKKLSAEKLVADIRTRYYETFAGNKAKLNSIVQTIVADAGKAEIAVGVLSFLPDETARQLLTRWDWQDTVKLLVLPETPPWRPHPDSWLKLAKLMARPGRSCAALVTDEAACKSALAAGLRCVVIPDTFTDCQDFGGADLVLEDVKDFHLKEMAALMRPCSFK